MGVKSASMLTNHAERPITVQTFPITRSTNVRTSPSEMCIRDRPGFPRSRKPPLVRMIDRLLPFAQLFIKLQPQAGVVFDNIAHLLHTLQVHFQLLRREIETKVITRFDQKFL